MWAEVVAIADLREGLTGAAVELELEADDVGVGLDDCICAAAGGGDLGADVDAREPEDEVDDEVEDALGLGALGAPEVVGHLGEERVERLDDGGDVGLVGA